MQGQTEPNGSCTQNRMTLGRLSTLAVTGLSPSLPAQTTRQYCTFIPAPKAFLSLYHLLQPMSLFANMHCPSATETICPVPWQAKATSCNIFFSNPNAKCANTILLFFSRTLASFVYSKLEHFFLLPIIFLELLNVTLIIINLPLMFLESIVSPSPSSYTQETPVALPAVRASSLQPGFDQLPHLLS